jgi:hypothetical protein
MTNLLPTSETLTAQPNHPVLLVCGPAAIGAARALLPAYLVGSWATADYFDSAGGEPITNGALRSLAGRRVDVWASVRKERWPHLAVVTELLRLGCSVRVIEPQGGESIEPFSAQAAGMTSAQIVAYARSRIRILTAQEFEPDPTMEWDAPSDAPIDDDPPEAPHGVLSDMARAAYAPSERLNVDDELRWEPPIDLWTARPVVPMRITCLPPRFREYVAEQCDLIGCDASVVGLSALVCAASVIDDGFRVQPKEHDTTWTESARLWGAIVGDPSTKKSPGMRSAMSPVRKIDAKLAAQYADVMREHEEELAAHAALRGKDKPPPPERPASPRVLTQNATVEALSDILKDNPQGLLCAPDELSGWFGSLDVYSKGGSKDRALWLEAYNGGPQRIDRVTRGHIFVPNWSACLLGGIQPDIFRSIASKLDNDGLLQRFMVVIGTRAGTDIDRTPNAELIADYHKILYQLREMRVRGEMEVYRLAPEAQEVRRMFTATIDRAAATELPRGMAGYLGKWSGLFARLMCTYHMIDHAGRTPPTFIEAETAMHVCELMESCLYPHAYQFYGEMLGQNDLLQHVGWIAGHILATNAMEITTREVSQRYKHFNTLGDGAHRSIWIRLEDYGWVRPHPTARINKRSNLPVRWDVNPEVHIAFQDRAKIERMARAESRARIELSAAERREQGGKGDG